MDLPRIDYLPRDPAHYRPAIGLVGCGAITKEHLTAYRDADYKVAALCDIDRSAAAARRKEFFPQAMVTTDLDELLADRKIEVVDIATHVAVLPAAGRSRTAGEQTCAESKAVCARSRGGATTHLSCRSTQP